MSRMKATTLYALTLVVSCSILKLVSSFIGSCFGHAMSKATQYATNEIEVCVGMIEVSLKQAQVTLQQTITWRKKFAEGL